MHPLPRTPGLVAAAVAGLLFVAPSVARAQQDDPKLPYERYKLDNGLEVILHQDNSVPLVVVDVWYHVGSGQEVPGKSGFAHLFEHMLFQGSEHVGDDRIFPILKAIGASVTNGSTTEDRTNYFEVIPSNQLETGLWLESDRMGYFLPKLTKEALDNQIEVVRNERRQRVENVPYGRSMLGLQELLFPEGHPYHFEVIGRPEDLVSSSLDDVRTFYKKWYVPANATLCLAGDFDKAEAKKLVQKWFGSFPVTRKPESTPVPTPVVKRTRKVFDDEFAKMRRLVYAWHTPAMFAPGDAEADILASTLAGRDRTGRLYKILVLDEQLAQSVNARQSSDQWSSVFQISVMVKTGADLDKIEAILDRELDRAMKEPITQREFQRAVTGFEAMYVWGLEHLLSRAERLQSYNQYVGQPDYITQDLDRYRTSSPAKVRDFAAKFLGKDKRIEVLTMPAAPAEKKGGK